MQHRLLDGVFLAALLRAMCIALLAGPASAVTISYVQDLRQISANSFVTKPEFHGEGATAQPSPEFSDFIDAIVYANGEALQTSLLYDTGLYAQGLARGEADLNLGGGGASVFHVVFTVDETAPWTLQGSLVLQPNQTGDSSAEGRVSLSSGGSPLFALALPPGSGVLTVPFFASGELTPGEYDLLIEATSTTATPGRASFHLFLNVPEPSTSLMLLSGLVVLGVRRWRWSSDLLRRDRSQEHLSK